MVDDGIPMPPSDDLLLERLLQVIDEGRRTATYKLALILALLDCSAQHPGAADLPTREIARRVVEIYYLQSRAYAAHDGITRELRQITMKSAPPLRAVLRLRIAAEASGCRSVHEAARRLPDEYDTAVTAVEETFVRYPIPLLQVVGSRLVPFLYDVDWSEGASARALRREGRDRIRLLPGVADRLVVLGPLLRPLVELHWTRDVARWSGVATEDDRLHAHLFGVDRASFPAAIRSGLRELQVGSCFYCGERLGDRAEVDHFLPWSRWPNDAIENLVLADRSCNGSKRDHLVAPDHLEHWMQRLSKCRADLADLAAGSRWESDAVRSAALVRSTYTHVPTGTPLWHHGVEFVAADDRLAALLGA